MGRKGKKKQTVVSIFTQILIAMPILTIVLSLLAAKIILSGTIREANLMGCVYTIGAIVSFLLSLYCALRMPQKKLIWGSAVAVLYAVMLLLGNLLFFGIGYGSMLPTLGAVLLGGIAGSLLGSVKRSKYA